VQTLAGLRYPAVSRHGERLARNLEAAARYFSERGTVHVPYLASVRLTDGSEVNLGAWLSNHRHDLRSDAAPWQAAAAVLGALGARGLDAPAAGPAAAGGTGQPGEARQRLLPVVTVVTGREGQTRRQEAGQLPDAPLDTDEELRITGWVLTLDQLVWRPEADREFPFRDRDDPQNRVDAQFAGPDGRVHPAVGVRGARMLDKTRFRAMARDPDEPRLTIAGHLTEVIRSLEQDVARMVQATIDGQAAPRIFARILTRDDDLPLHEQPVLEGQYGAFLTPEAQNAPAGARPLASRGQALALYSGADLGDLDNPDNPGQLTQWLNDHPSYQAYLMELPASVMSPEGFAGSAAFANTRLDPRAAAPPATDRSWTGVNTELWSFEIEMTTPPGPDGHQHTVRRHIIVLLALDNLYAPHNQRHMVIADYGDNYQFHHDPPVKPEPDTTPPPPPAPAPQPRRRRRRRQG
jgi:hypothetical protein